MYSDPNWISNFVDPDPYSEYGSTQVKNRINKVVRLEKKIRDPDKNSMYLDWIHNTADAKIQLSGWALASGLWPRGAI